MTDEPRSNCNAPGRLVIRFDGPPGPVAGRFVECEIDGASVNAGTWVQDGDYWLLVLNPFDPAALAERDRVRSFVAESLPFLREAWEACFHGQKERLLSAEERGMGRLLVAFQEVADGKPTLPMGVLTREEASKEVNAAIAWAHKLLGYPNELREPLREWVEVGQTCADGLDKCHAAYTVALERAEKAERERDEARKRERTGVEEAAVALADAFCCASPDVPTFLVDGYIEAKVAAAALASAEEER